MIEWGALIGAAAHVAGRAAVIHRTAYSDASGAPVGAARCEYCGLSTKAPPSGPQRCDGCGAPLSAAQERARLGDRPGPIVGYDPRIEAWVDAEGRVVLTRAAAMQSAR